MKQYIVDAFAETLFSGNPAAVLPCHQMPDSEFMLQIARENNYSETAFVVPRKNKESEREDKPSLIPSQGHYDLKWFTPGGEIDLCGHATLATAFVVHHFVDKGVEEMHFHTLSGELIVRREDTGFTMDFPLGKIKPIPLTESILEATAHLAKEAYYDGGDMVVVVSSPKALREFVPEEASIKKLDGLGLILTAKASEEDGEGAYDFVSRCFYPKLQILEDPVTGRAHTYLTPLWEQKLGKRVMHAKQVSKRGGAMTVRLGDEGDRVFLTGQVQLFMDGEIPFDV